LATLGLSARGHELAASLPYGDQRRLEIARALATHPKILLLDEPGTGLSEMPAFYPTPLGRSQRFSTRVGSRLASNAKASS